MPMVSSDNGDNSNVSSDDRKASSDQLEQRVRAKIEKEKEGNMKQSTAVAVHVTCAAGHHCMADPEIAIDLINSPHECLNCCEKMHDPYTCGEIFDDVEDIHGFAIPTHMLSENGQLKLREQVGASSLAICCLCIEKCREASRPSAYTATAYEKMDLAIKQTIQNTHQMSPPVPPAAEVKIAACAAADYDEMDAAIKQAAKITAQISPSLPPANVANMAAMVEDTAVQNKKEADMNKTAEDMDGNTGDAWEPQNAQTQQAAPIITRPPPRSMMPSNLQSASSLPVLQATLVEEEPQAPVYDAIPLQSSDDQSVPWWKRRTVLVMGCVIVALAVTVGALIGLLGSNDSNESAISGNVDGEGGSDRGDGLLGSNSDNESTLSESINAEGGSATSDEFKEVAVLNSHQPSQYPSQQGDTTIDDSKEVAVLDSLQPSQYPNPRSSTTPSFSPSCVQYNYISTSPVFCAISGKGIVFAIQSDVDDEDGLEITSLGFHVNSEDLTRSNGNNNNAEGGFIEYEVYALRDGAGSPDGYYADPNRSEDFNNVLADTDSYDFRGQMDQWELIASGNITSIDNLTQAITTIDNIDPDYFQIPYEGFTKTSVQGKGKVRSFYIATPRTASFSYADPPVGKLVNSETALSEGSLMEGEYTPKILTGEGVATYPMDTSAFMYQTKSFVGTVYWERGAPSVLPSFSPTTLKLESIEACQCDVLQKCIEEPLVPSSRDVRLCLMSTPQMNILKSIVVMFVTQPGADMHLIVRADTAEDSETKIDASIRRRVVETVVPLYFFSNLSETVVVKGVGKVLRTGTAADNTRDIEFTIPLTLHSEPSSAPSTRLVPSLTSSTPLDIITPSPTYIPTTSVAPSDLPPVGIKACQCNNQGECLENVLQHYWSRNVMICLQSTPPQSEIVRIETLYFELTDGIHSAALVTQPVISGDQTVATPGLLSEMLAGGPPGLANKEYNRRRTIKTVLKGKFFDYDATSMELKAKGFALVIDTTGDTSLRRLDTATATIEIDMLLGNPPSSAPSFYSSLLPTYPPTAYSPTFIAVCGTDPNDAQMNICTNPRCPTGDNCAVGGCYAFAYQECPDIVPTTDAPSTPPTPPLPPTPTAPPSPEPSVLPVTPSPTGSPVYNKFFCGASYQMAETNCWTADTCSAVKACTKPGEQCFGIYSERCNRPAPTDEPTTPPVSGPQPTDSP